MSRQKYFSQQIERYFYGLSSASIMFVILAAIGVVISWGSLEALVVYSLIIAINVSITVVGLLFVKWFAVAVNSEESEYEG